MKFSSRKKNFSSWEEIREYAEGILKPVKGAENYTDILTALILKFERYKA